MGDQHHPPAALYPGKGTSTHFTGGWVDLGPILDGYGKSRPHRGSCRGLSIPWRVAIPTDLSLPPQYLRTAWNTVGRRCIM